MKRAGRPWVRLRRIFADERSADLATPHFVLLSPRRPERLHSHDWPHWMTPNGEPVWMELRQPEGLRKVTRCDAEGTASASGTRLRVNAN